MLFKKLFQVLVLGGAVVGTTSGCSQTAEAQTTSPKKPMSDAGAAHDAGPTQSTGGGVPGW